MTLAEPPPPLIDKKLLRQRLARAMSATAPQASFLLDHVGMELSERLSAVERSFATGVLLAPAIGSTAAAVAATGRVDTLFSLGIAAAGAPVAAVADEEMLPLADRSIDLFLSALVFQFTNDLPGALAQILRALRPDGLMLAALAGGNTLRELREVLVPAETEINGGISPRIIPFAELRDVGGLLQRAGFALPVADRDLITVRYDTAFDLMRDLRRMGATNPLAERSRRPTSRRLLQRTAELYAERYSDPDGRVRATFEIISLSGWAPHESQQKPARRGSAQVSLAAALSRGSGRPA